MEGLEATPENFENLTVKRCIFGGSSISISYLGICYWKQIFAPSPFSEQVPQSKFRATEQILSSAANSKFCGARREICSNATIGQPCVSIGTLSLTKYRQDTVRHMCYIAVIVPSATELSLEVVSNTRPSTIPVLYPRKVIPNHGQCLKLVLAFLLLQ